MKGYKGFKKGLVCRGKQYAENTVFVEDKAEICESGMHFCEAPFDVWEHYPPCDENGNLNEFAEVEALADTQTDDERKFCTTKLRIGAKISFADFVKAGVDFVLNKTKSNTNSNTGDYSAATNTGDYSAATNTGYCSAATNTGNYSAATNTGDCSAATNTGNYSVATNTGYYSAATNTGDCSAATNTGYYSVATNTGYYSVATNTGNYSAATNTGNYSAATNTGNYSAATNTGYYSVATNTGYRSAATVNGDDSVAIVTGYKGKAKGKIGCWIACVERNEKYKIIDFKAVKVDGETIKPDVFYRLENGKFVEVEGDLKNV